MNESMYAFSVNSSMEFDDLAIKLMECITNESSEFQIPNEKKNSDLNFYVWIMRSHTIERNC